VRRLVWTRGGGDVGECRRHCKGGRRYQGACWTWGSEMKGTLSGLMVSHAVISLIIRLYNETLRQCPHGDHEGPSADSRAHRTQVPSFHTSPSPANCTVSRSSTHTSPAIDRRADHHRDAFERLEDVSKAGGERNTTHLWHKR
jgi:hypothetical protein